MKSKLMVRRPVFILDLKAAMFNKARSFVGKKSSRLAYTLLDCQWQENGRKTAKNEKKQLSKTIF